MNPGVCTGPQSCRWCQLIGALAFDEPRPDLVVGHSSGVGRQTGAALQLLAADATAGAGEAAAAAEPTPGSVTAAPASGEAAPPVAGANWRHPKLPAPWASCNPPPTWTPAQRSQDPDFRIAQRTLGVAMTQAQIDQVYRSSMELDAPWIERQRIDYRFWSLSEFTTMWSTLWAIASQPFVERFCVGVLTSASWRWSRCEGHGSMEPHRYSYDVMYVISANYGDAACALERLLQAKIAETHTQQCVHGGYKRGPVRSATKNIIYVCIKHR